MRANKITRVDLDTYGMSNRPYYVYMQKTFLFFFYIQIQTLSFTEK